MEECAMESKALAMKTQIKFLLQMVDFTAGVGFIKKPPVDCFFLSVSDGAVPVKVTPQKFRPAKPA
jgi:hypothetical protein